MERPTGHPAQLGADSDAEASTVQWRDDPAHRVAEGVVADRLDGSTCTSPWWKAPSGVRARTMASCSSRWWLPRDTDVATLVFQLNALVIAANTAYLLHEDPTALTQARTAVDRVIQVATATTGPDSA